VDQWFKASLSCVRRCRASRLDVGADVPLRVRSVRWQPCKGDDVSNDLWRYPEVGNENTQLVVAEVYRLRKRRRLSVSVAVWQTDPRSLSW
jgi:hypothetical protein